MGSRRLYFGLPEQGKLIAFTILTAAAPPAKPPQGRSVAQRKAAVVGGNDRRRQHNAGPFLVGTVDQCRTGTGVVNARPLMAEHLLKELAVFPKIMKETQHGSPVRIAEFREEGTA